MSKDANDVLRERGPDALRRLIDQTAPSAQRNRDLDIGSENEVASRVAEDLKQSFGETVFSEGDFYAFNGQFWEKLRDEKILPLIRAYDGRAYKSANGSQQRFSLSKSKQDGVYKLLGERLADCEFFRDPPRGLACRSGFIALSDDGDATLLAHSPDQRQRHLVDARWTGELWTAPEPDSLLGTLLFGCFGTGDEADAHYDMMAEFIGAAAFELSTRLPEPKAIVLLGETAANGKSQCLQVMRGLFPQSATAALPPAEMANEQRRAQLAGVALNAVDELGAAAVRSDTFKTIITGDRTAGKHVYKQPFEFHLVALHVFATNALPQFSDGMDRGVRRRLAILPFERTIPPDERIPDLGTLIVTEELDAVLAMAVHGASRVRKNRGFTISEAGKQRLSEWAVLSDPVEAFLQDGDAVRITGREGDLIPTKRMYLKFKQWAKGEGIPEVKLPTHTQFTARAKAMALPNLKIARSGAHGTRFCGVQFVSGASDA